MVELGNQSKRLLCINVSGPNVFNFVFNYQVVGNLIYLLTSTVSTNLYVLTISKNVPMKGFWKIIFLLSHSY